jgi:acyl-CoA thioester hydrolase
VSRSLYKQTMLDDLRDVTNDAAAPRVVTPPALPPHDIQFRVRYAETDQMGVVYHTNYLIWCEVGRTDFIRARGMSYADIERSGVGLAVSDLEARFHGAARYDDLIRVRTTLADVRSRSITFDYLITNAETNERLVSASTTLVSIDKNGRLVAIPSMVRALFHPADSHSHPHGKTPENR